MTAASLCLLNVWPVVNGGCDRRCRGCFQRALTYWDITCTATWCRFLRSSGVCARSLELHLSLVLSQSPQGHILYRLSWIRSMQTLPHQVHPRGKKLTVAVLVLVRSYDHKPGKLALRLMLTCVL